MYQIVFKMTDDGRREVARIQDGKITGELADRVRELLVKNGWPEKPAHFILFGDYLWATKPSEGIAPGEPGQLD